MVSARELVPGLISVVIPVGEVNDWLNEAVSSVLRQSEASFEVIAVFNNGAEIPPDWPPLSDPRVRTLTFREPLGSGGAGQAGIEAATGQFFVRLDADDRMRPERLREQLDWLNTHPTCVLVSSQVDWIDEDGRRTGAFRLPFGRDVRKYLLSLNVCPHSSWMARMEDVRQVGGYDPLQTQMDDYDLLLRLAVRGEVAILPSTLTDYRLHGAQMSRAVKPWGRYIRVIRDRHRDLGAAIKIQATAARIRSLWWEAQQWIMFLGRKLRP